MRCFLDRTRKGYRGYAMKHHRSVLVLITVALLAALAVPAAAEAKPGWLLPTATSVSGGQTNTSRAIHCGTSQFGVYTFRNGTKVGGRKGFVDFRVLITQDGVGHKAKFLQFGGKLSKALKAQTRALLNRVTFRYGPGPPPVVQSVEPTGAIQAQRAFNPVPAKCPKKKK
jgi:hypothetical protein